MIKLTRAQQEVMDILEQDGGKSILVAKGGKMRTLNKLVEYGLITLGRMNEVEMPYSRKGRYCYCTEITVYRNK
jgi:hypothetical protein